MDSSATELKVRKIIADSLCVDIEDVHLKASLMKDLGAESIDFLDIVFRLEKDFDIKIPQREIEKKARGGIAPEDFEIDGVLKAKGAERLRELLPEISAAEIKEGMLMRELPAKFNVEVFVNIVKRKLSGEFSDDSSDVVSTEVAGK
jgi:acyl carrier protein